MKYLNRTTFLILCLVSIFGVSLYQVNQISAALSVLTVPQGGTGWGNFFANTLLTGNGTGAIATTTIGSGLTLSGGVLSASGGSGFDWTILTVNGVAYTATTSPLYLLHASASTTVSWGLESIKAVGIGSVSTTTIFGNGATSSFQQGIIAGNIRATSTIQSSSLTVTGLTSALINADAGGNTLEYAGTSCTNQFPRSLDAVGAATCASVALGSDVTGTLGITNGGTGLGAVGASSTILTTNATVNAYRSDVQLTSLRINGNGLNPLVISTSTIVWYFNSNGYLGYGTTSPSNALSLQNGSAFSVEKALTDAATIEVDWASANQGRVTTAATGRTIQFRNGKPGQGYRLIVCKDGTNASSITNWSSSETWPVYFSSANGTATTTPNQSDNPQNNNCLWYSFIVTSGTSTPFYMGSIPAYTY